MFPQLKLPQIQKIMMEFEKQSEMMDMKEEMMNDAIDDAMGDEDDEEERLERIPLLPVCLCDFIYFRFRLKEGKESPPCDTDMNNLMKLILIW